MLIPTKDQDHPSAEDGYLEVEIPSFPGEPIYKCKTCAHNATSITEIEAHVTILHPTPKETMLPDDSTVYVYECDLDGCHFSTNLAEMYYKHLDVKHNIYITGATPSNNHKKQGGTRVYDNYYNYGRETRQEQVPVKTREIAVDYWKDRYSIKDKVGNEETTE